jgi:hypothetical protein
VFSDFVGLLLMRLIPLPDFPPMNSDVPRRWRDGIVRDDGEPGDRGDRGGDVIPVAGSSADGLNENVGRPAGIERVLSPSGIPSLNPLTDNSIVENGRLAVALE